jgi:hypothetical protein
MMYNTKTLLFNVPTKSSPAFMIYLSVASLLIGGGIFLTFMAVHRFIVEGSSGTGIFYLMAAGVFFIIVLASTVMLQQITLDEEGLIIESWFSVFLKGNAKVIIPYKSIQKIEWVNPRPDAKSMENYYKAALGSPRANVDYYFGWLDSYSMIIQYGGKTEKTNLSLFRLLNYKDLKAMEQTLRKGLGSEIVPNPVS